MMSPPQIVVLFVAQSTMLVSSSLSIGQTPSLSRSTSHSIEFAKVFEHTDDKRIIMIGERYHTDSVAYEYHGALVEALVNRYDDIYILSETSFHTSSIIVKADPSLDTIRTSLQGEWLKALARVDNLQYNGLDCSISVRADKDLLALAQQCGFAAEMIASPSWTNWLQKFKGLSVKGWNKALSDEYSQACDELHRTISMMTCVDGGDVEFIHRYIYSSSSELHFDTRYWGRALKRRKMNMRVHNYRDSAMADNIGYFIRTSKPGTKFVVLMSNYHIMRNATAIGSGISEKKSKIKTTADWLFEKYGEDMYSIATINYKDMRERIHDLRSEQSDRSSKSIEYQLSQTCTEGPCFIDISHDGRSWIMSPTFWKKNLKAPWGVIFGGLLFFKEL